MSLHMVDKHKITVREDVCSQTAVSKPIKGKLYGRKTWIVMSGGTLERQTIHVA